MLRAGSASRSLFCWSIIRLRLNSAVFEVSDVSAFSQLLLTKNRGQYAGLCIVYLQHMHAHTHAHKNAHPLSYTHAHTCAHTQYTGTSSLACVACSVSCLPVFACPHGSRTGRTWHYGNAHRGPTRFEPPVRCCLWFLASVAQ